MSSFADAYMTRRGYEDGVSLRDRAKIANQFEADLFVSIHCNGYSDEDVRGAETLYWHTSKAGKDLAQSIQVELISTIDIPSRGIKPRDDLAVLRDTSMTAVLVETEFVTNPDAEKLLNNWAVKQTIAESITRGTRKYLQENGGLL